MDSIGDFVRNNLPASNAERMVQALQRAYEAAYNGLAQNQELHLEYHSPAGEVMRISRLTLDVKADAWLLDGQSENTGEWGRVFAPANTTHIMMRLVTVEGEPERRPVGFTVDDERTTG